jgi:hypothetical protein
VEVQTGEQNVVGLDGGDVGGVTADELLVEGRKTVAPRRVR